VDLLLAALSLLVVSPLTAHAPPFPSAFPLPRASNLKKRPNQNKGRREKKMTKVTYICCSAKKK
jgi:hypothetical protein